jgi:hypothetical protein
MTRDQLIETMARALAREEWPHAGADARASWEHNRWPDYVREATATLTAIEAAGMRVVPVEPSEKMKRAGIDAAPMVLIEKQPIGQRRRESWNTDECAEVYRAMLNAAQEDSTSE